MTSSVWKLFKINDPSESTAICIPCGKQISRGSNNSGQKSFSTTPLHNHAESFIINSTAQSRRKFHHQLHCTITPKSFIINSTAQSRRKFHHQLHCTITPKSFIINSTAQSRRKFHHHLHCTITPKSFI